MTLDKCVRVCACVWHMHEMRNGASCCSYCNVWMALCPQNQDPWINLKTCLQSYRTIVYWTLWINNRKTCLAFAYFHRVASKFQSLVVMRILSEVKGSTIFCWSILLIVSYIDSFFVRHTQFLFRQPSFSELLQVGLGHLKSPLGIIREFLHARRFLTLCQPLKILNESKSTDWNQRNHSSVLILFLTFQHCTLFAGYPTLSYLFLCKYIP